MRRSLNTRLRRLGVTLIEMLVAIAVSLIVMLAVVTVFDQLNDAMNRSKAIIEQMGELRNVTQRLRQDLAGMTAATLLWTPTGAGDGYFECIERPQRDMDQAAAMWGARDDVLMFTARSKGRPFIGRFNNQLIESELAEIIWWVDGSGATDPQQVRLMRRCLLIRPDLAPSGASVAAFLENNDVSVRLESGSLRANSLADLTLRQNRVLHAAQFPHEMSSVLLPIPAGNDAFGTDVVLNKVVAFDVRVYDPLAPLQLKSTAQGNVIVGPGDPGYDVATAATSPAGRGAYVDLNYAGDNTVSFYSGPPNAKSQLTIPTYSTWPFFYEQDGIDQDGDGTPDQGTDGFDSNGNGMVDDPSEYETSPPYPHAIALNGVVQKTPGLRGIEVRIRIVEPDSRSVRQASVVANFVPE